jgi:hypothetical protein
MTNAIVAKTNDEFVVIDFDELVYFNLADDCIYLHFKNSKNDFEVNGSDELIQQIVDGMRIKLGK